MPEEPRIPLRYICVKRRPGTEDPPVVAEPRAKWSASRCLWVALIVTALATMVMQQTEARSFAWIPGISWIVCAFLLIDRGVRKAQGVA